MNILLIGFMGSGKSTIGRKLAKLLEYSFVDTDTVIEEDQGCSVSEIFKYGGEECFRKMETRLLQKLKNVENSVIATGGGIVLREQNQRLLQEIGKRVYLNVPQEELQQRLTKDRNRPLLKKKDLETVVQKMMKERVLLYEQAEYIVDAGQRSPQKIASEIINKLCNEDHDNNF